VEELDLRTGVWVKVVKWCNPWYGVFWRFTYFTRIVWIALLPPWAIKVTIGG